MRYWDELNRKIHVTAHFANELDQQDTRSGWFNPECSLVDVVRILEIPNMKLKKIETDRIRDALKYLNPGLHL